jgi:hypothetical protein
MAVGPVPGSDRHPFSSRAPPSKTVVDATHAGLSGLLVDDLIPAPTLQCRHAPWRWPCPGKSFPAITLWMPNDRLALLSRLAAEAGGRALEHQPLRPASAGLETHRSREGMTARSGILPSP